MKDTKHTHLISSLAIVAVFFTTLVTADDSDVELSTPSAEEISKNDATLEYRTKTVYESSWLPGVRLCEEDEVDYHGGLRKVNCQDDKLIDAVSTREPDPYNTKPNIIVDDAVQPNGNILRIQFRKKSYTHVNTSDN